MYSFSSIHTFGLRSALDWRTESCFTPELTERPRQVGTREAAFRLTDQAHSPPVSAKRPPLAGVMLSARFLSRWPDREARLARAEQGPSSAVRSSHALWGDAPNTRANARLGRTAAPIVESALAFMGWSRTWVPGTHLPWHACRRALSLWLGCTSGTDQERQEDEGRDDPHGGLLSFVGFNPPALRGGIP